MERTPEPNRYNINRQSPQYAYKLGKITLELTYENTSLCIFDDPYTDVTHVFVADEACGDFYIFGDEELLDDLDKRHYPKMVNPYPVDEDLDQFFLWQRDHIDEDVELLLAENDE